MNNNFLKIIKIVLLSIIICLLIMLLSVTLTNQVTFPVIKTKSQTKKIVDKKIESQIDTIKVNTRSADVEIFSGSVTNIEVKVYNDKDKNIIINEDNSILEIIDNEKNYCIGFCLYQKSKIEIIVPNEKILNYEIDSVSGDVYLNLPISLLKAKTVSGDLHINDVDKANINTTSGDIRIRNVNELIIDSISGDLDINQIMVYINARLTSGDIEINDLMLEKEGIIETTSGDVEIKRTNNVYIETSTTSGEVDIRNNNHQSNIVLKIRTLSGDIEVEED